MYKVSLVPLVDLLTCFLHVLGHARWATAKNTNFPYLETKSKKKELRIPEMQKNK